MDDGRVTELAAAIRMSCSNPDVVAGAGERPVIVSLDDSAEAVALADAGEGLASAARRAKLPPPVELAHDSSARQAAQKLSSAMRAGGDVPAVVTVAGAGLFDVGRTKADAVRRGRCLREGRAYEAEREELPGGRLRGHVVVVTGSAQGFGKGIAEALAGEGAHVVVADLKDDAGRTTAESIHESAGEGHATFCHADVTDEESVRALVSHAFRTYGGIDMFISNAGVLRAGGLDEMDARTFEFVTKVNYTAFFLCAKAVAPALRLQYEFNPHHVTDIIQINSKSGLQGSNRNFAYAGGKFGAIGLVQSFAMELVGYNVKVNAVCPGNYYDGPLWSDPDNGLFVQYLRAGKVPGATTMEEVKTHYLGRTPIKRGCLPRDVATAILYLHDQEYETGQALPVTGGQVMLR